MKAILSTLVLLFAAQILFAQQPEGVIKTTADAVQSEGIHLPDGIAVYDAPRGEVAGVVQDGQICDMDGNCLPILPELATPDADFMFFEHQDGYVRFYSEADHYWLKETELLDKGYDVIFY